MCGRWSGLEHGCSFAACMHAFLPPRLFLRKCFSGFKDKGGGNDVTLPLVPSLGTRRHVEPPSLLPIGFLSAGFSIYTQVLPVSASF